MDTAKIQSVVNNCFMNMYPTKLKDSEEMDWDICEFPHLNQEDLKSLNNPIIDNESEEAMKTYQWENAKVWMRSLLKFKNPQWNFNIFTPQSFLQSLKEILLTKSLLLAMTALISK